VKYLVLVLTGCMPYVIPPVTGTVGATHSTARGTRTGVHVDAGLSPVQLVRGQMHRRWDATVSASFDHEAHSTWGAAIAAGPVLHPWGTPRDERSARLMPQLVGRLTTENRAIALRLAAERTWFASGDDRSEEGGLAWGEVAIGFYAEAAYVKPDGARDDAHWMFSAGVAFRLPAMVGVAQGR
jgi:hypothetical protein